MLISIIVPIYNKEKYLRKCIESLLNQTYKDIEIILINDGSTDNSKKICEEYEKNYTNIKFFDKTNGGVSSARNIGLEKSSGEKVLFVDADDYVKEDYVCSLNKYEENLVICGYITVNLSNVRESQNYNIKMKGKSNVIKECLNKKYANLMVTPYLKLFDRNIIENNHIRFDETMSFGEDACFVFEYLNCINSVRFIPYNGYYNFVVDGTLSRKHIKNIDIQTNKLYQTIRKFNQYIDKETIDYWFFRNIKIILFNEKNNSRKDFYKAIEKIKKYNELNSLNENDDIFSKYDKIIIKLLKKNYNYILYIIYSKIRWR